MTTLDEYAAIYKKVRWFEFEKALEDYCDDLGLFTTNQLFLILYK